MIYKYRLRLRLIFTCPYVCSSDSFQIFSKFPSLVSSDPCSACACHFSIESSHLFCFLVILVLYCRETTVHFPPSHLHRIPLHNSICLSKMKARKASLKKKYGPFLFSNSSRGSCTQLHDSPRDLVAKPAREKNLKKNRKHSKTRGIFAPTK